MAYRKTQSPAGHGRDLRAEMVAKAIARREFWLEMKGSSPAGRAYIERTAGAEVERWRGGERVECDAWSLPDWARGEFHPSLRVVVLADGSVEIAQPQAPELRLLGGGWS